MLPRPEMHFPLCAMIICVLISFFLSLFKQLIIHLFLKVFGLIPQIGLFIAGHDSLQAKMKHKL